MTHSATLTASVLSLLMLAGCSSDDESSGDPPPTGDDAGGVLGDDAAPGAGDDVPLNPDDASAPLIDGQWLSSCGAADDPQAVTERTEIAIADSVFVLIESTYGDMTCNDAQRALTFTGTFAEQPLDDGQELTDGIPVNLEFTQATLTPLLLVVSNFYNDSMLCGETSWSPEVDMDVSTCQELLGESIVPRTDYNRFYVDDQGTPDDRSDDVVLLGTLDASPRESGRPMRVDPELRFTRRP